RIDGGASPLRCAVETGEHNRFGSHSERNELAFVNRRLESFRRPLVTLRSTRRQQVFGEILPCVGGGPCRQALLCRSNFTWKHACGVLTILDRDQRLGRGPIEDKQEALLACLNDSIDGLAIAFQCNQHWSGGEIAIP